jgi:hypothetical protein
MVSIPTEASGLGYDAFEKSSLAQNRMLSYGQNPDRSVV